MRRSVVVIVGVVGALAAVPSRASGTGEDPPAPTFLSGGPEAGTPAPAGSVSGYPDLSARCIAERAAVAFPTAEALTYADGGTTVEVVQQRPKDIRRVFDTNKSKLLELAEVEALARNNPTWYAESTYDALIDWAGLVRDWFRDPHAVAAVTGGNPELLPQFKAELTKYETADPSAASRRPQAVTGSGPPRYFIPVPEVLTRFDTDGSRRLETRELWQLSVYVPDWYLYGDYHRITNWESVGRAHKDDPRVTDCLFGGNPFRIQRFKQALVDLDVDASYASFVVEGAELERGGRRPDVDITPPTYDIIDSRFGEDQRVVRYDQAGNVVDHVTWDWPQVVSFGETFQPSLHGLKLHKVRPIPVMFHEEMLPRLLAMGYDTLVTEWIPAGASAAEIQSYLDTGVITEEAAPVWYRTLQPTGRGPINLLPDALVSLRKAWLAQRAKGRELTIVGCGPSAPIQMRPNEQASWVPRAQLAQNPHNEQEAVARSVREYTSKTLAKAPGTLIVVYVSSEYNQPGSGRFWPGKGSDEIKRRFVDLGLPDFMAAKDYEYLHTTHDLKGMVKASDLTAEQHAARVQDVEKWIVFEREDGVHQVVAPYVDPQSLKEK